MIFVLSFAIFCLAMILMAVGVILGRRPLAARCGDESCCKNRSDACRQFCRAQQHKGAER